MHRQMKAAPAWTMLEAYAVETAYLKSKAKLGSVSQFSVLQSAGLRPQHSALQRYKRVTLTLAVLPGFILALLWFISPSCLPRGIHKFSSPSSALFIHILSYRSFLREPASNSTMPQVSSARFHIAVSFSSSTPNLLRTRTFFQNIILLIFM
jgi:hypothetical protein